MLIQSQDESKQQQQENDETKRQIEEDADRELLNMRIRHEQLVREQQASHVTLGRPRIYWELVFQKSTS